MRATGLAAPERGREHEPRDNGNVFLRARGTPPVGEPAKRNGHGRAMPKGPETLADEVPKCLDPRGLVRRQPRAARHLERGRRRRQRHGQGRRAQRARDALAEDEPFEQRVAREPVAAMQACRRHFAAGPEAGQRRRALSVGRDAAHVEVGGSRDRERLASGVEARSRGDGASAGEAFRKSGNSGCVEVHRPAGQRARGDAARDDVARREFGVGVNRGHEAPAAFVEEQGACAAQRLGQERLGIARDRECGRVKLHELEVGKAHAGARRGGETRTP